jgi:hypothetical protein
MKHSTHTKHFVAYRVAKPVARIEEPVAEVEAVEVVVKAETREAAKAAAETTIAALRTKCELRFQGIN